MKVRMTDVNGKVYDMDVNVFGNPDCWGNIAFSDIDWDNVDIDYDNICSVKII